MKDLALLILALSMTLSCSNKKKKKKRIKKTITDSAQVNKEIPIEKPNFSPGTLALNIKIIDITTYDNYGEITATIEKSLGSGDGIIGVYSEGRKVSFKAKIKF